MDIFHSIGGLGGDGIVDFGPTPEGALGGVTGVGAHAAVVALAGTGVERFTGSGAEIAAAASSGSGKQRNIGTGEELAAASTTGSAVQRNIGTGSFEITPEADGVGVNTPPSVGHNTGVGSFEIPTPQGSGYATVTIKQPQPGVGGGAGWHPGRRIHMPPPPITPRPQPPQQRVTGSGGFAISMQFSGVGTRRLTLEQIQRDDEEVLMILASRRPPSYVDPSATQVTLDGWR